MEIGETVAYIREQKGLRIKDICGNQISRQSYTKFVKGESRTSITNFNYILDKLCVEFDEFMMIKNGFEEKEYIKLMRSLKHSFESKNQSNIVNIRRYCFENQNTNQKFLHLYYIADILLSKLQSISYENSANLMKKYLIGVNSWTHYELVLFNNTMFIFDSETLEAIINKTSSNLEKYVQIKGYGNESIRMLLNICFLLIQGKELNKLRKYLNILKNAQLSEDAIFERCSIIFIEAITNFISEENYSEIKILEAINIFKFTNSHNLYRMYYDLYIFVKENLDQFKFIVF